MLLTRHERCAARGVRRGARDAEPVKCRGLAAHNASARAPQEVHDSVTHSQKAHNEPHEPGLSHIKTFCSDDVPLIPITTYRYVLHYNNFSLTNYTDCSCNLAFM